VNAIDISHEWRMDRIADQFAGALPQFSACSAGTARAARMKFTCPSVVLRYGATNSGATEIFQPWSDAVAQAWLARSVELLT